MADVKYDALESSDARILGARMGVETMLYYYYTAIIGKVKDPKQYMASRMPVMIDLTDEQATYVGATISSDNAVMTSLTTSIELLKTMQDSKELDEESLSLVIGILESVQLNCTDALNMFLEKEDDDKGDLFEEGDL